MSVPVHLIPFLSARDNALRTMREISGIIRRNSIRVVNAHHFTPFFYSFYGARRHRCRLFFTAHSRAEIETAKRSWSFVAGIMIRHCDAAIGISPDVGEAIKGRFKFGANKVLTLTNAVNHRQFAHNGTRSAKRAEMGLKEDDIVIGCVGNLRQDKNHANLIKAFRIINDTIPGAKLIIAGEGQRRSELELLIASLGLDSKVSLLGARSDIPGIMHVMDIYCLPSFSEGLPLSLLEAMSAGLPVVGTDVRGIHDVVTHGITGLLVPSNNPGKLAEALLVMIHDRDFARDIAQKGSEYVVREYGFDAWIDRYESLFSGDTLRSGRDAKGAAQ